MSVDHHPRVLVVGRAHTAWVECGCGWVSPLFASAAAASAAWARHVGVK